MYGSTPVESLICRPRSQICTQYRLGVRFVRACHLALVQWGGVHHVQGGGGGGPVSLDIELLFVSSGAVSITFKVGEEGDPCL